jgi:hypothetical protein
MFLVFHISFQGRNKQKLFSNEKNQNSKGVTFSKQEEKQLSFAISNATEKATTFSPGQFDLSTKQEA